MADTIINPGFELTTRTVQTAIKITTGEHASITAPSVVGYTFVCWTNIASIGWIGAMYAEEASRPQTNVWLAATQYSSGANGTVYATALYAKTA